MSTRTERKSQAREERLAREREAAAREQRKRRLTLLGASALAAAAVVAVLIAVSQGGGDDAGNGSSGGRLAGTAEATKLFAGIPQSGATLGSPDAPVRMVEFVDLQCPFCAEYTRNVLPTLVTRYVRTGKLRIEMRPLTFIGDDSVTAAAAATAAAKQNRMWQFVDLFYLNQGTENSGYVTPAFLRRVARSAGVDAGPVLSASAAGDGGALVDQAQREASRAGINSTPSFLVAKGGQGLQRLNVSELTPSAFTNPIDDLLSGG
jgi:protein-disulfide isomerase